MDRRDGIAGAENDYLKWDLLFGFLGSTVGLGDGMELAIMLPAVLYLYVYPLPTTTTKQPSYNSYNTKRHKKYIYIIQLTEPSLSIHDFEQTNNL